MEHCRAFPPAGNVMPIHCNETEYLNGMGCCVGTVPLIEDLWTIKEIRCGGKERNSCTFSLIIGIQRKISHWKNKEPRVSFPLSCNLPTSAFYIVWIGIQKSDLSIDDAQMNLIQIGFETELFLRFTAALRTPFLLSLFLHFIWQDEKFSRCFFHFSFLRR